MASNYLPCLGCVLIIWREKVKRQNELCDNVIVDTCFCYESGLSHEGLYRVSGVKSRIEAVKTQFDQGRDLVCLSDVLFVVCMFPVIAICVTCLHHIQLSRAQNNDGTFTGRNGGLSARLQLCLETYVVKFSVPAFCNFFFLLSLR